MGDLRDRMEAEMKLRNLRPARRAQYLTCARKLAAHHPRSPPELSEEQVRAFLRHLPEERGLSPSTLIVYRAALGFLYRDTLQQPGVVASLDGPRRQSRLPEVLGGSEVKSLPRGDLDDVSPLGSTM